ncbi:MAG: hypothetical protein V2A73_14500, partial [Pseudomonadota bacterium]
DGELTNANTIVGTPLYMAPEMWRGEPAGRAADAYSLGAVFCDDATGPRSVRVAAGGAFPAAANDRDQAWQALARRSGLAGARARLP